MFLLNISELFVVEYLTNKLVKAPTEGSAIFNRCAEIIDRN